MYTGTDSRTPGGLGPNVTAGLAVRVTLGRLTLTFVPEPGTFRLLGAGVAALGLLRRRRMRARAEGVAG
jgi:PEP-CTERM motif